MTVDDSGRLSTVNGVAAGYDATGRASSVPSPDGIVVTTTGTSGDNTLIGTPGDDVINGCGGNDIICGRCGDDAIFGGTDLCETDVDVQGCEGPLPAGGAAVTWTRTFGSISIWFPVLVGVLAVVTWPVSVIYAIRHGPTAGLSSEDAALGGRS